MSPYCLAVSPYCLAVSPYPHVPLLPGGVPQPHTPPGDVGPSAPQDIKNKRNPRLVPYSLLDERTKKTNRDSLCEAVRTLIGYGYNIEPPDQESREWGRGAAGGPWLPLGALRGQWVPYGASGGALGSVGALWGQWVPYGATGGALGPVGALWGRWECFGVNGCNMGSVGALWGR